MVNKYIQELCDDVNESHRYLDEDYDTSYEDVLDWDNSAEHE